MENHVDKKTENGGLGGLEGGKGLRALRIWGVEFVATKGFF